MEEGNPSLEPTAVDYSAEPAGETLGADSGEPGAVDYTAEPAVEYDAVEYDAAAEPGAVEYAAEDGGEPTAVDYTAGEETAALEVALAAEEEGEELGAAAFAPPETGASAEIVAIITSFGAARRPFFSSIRVKHFLNCKGIVYYIVDSNRDVSGSTGLQDQTLLNQWKEANLLLKNPLDPDESMLCPQVLIDGVPIGDESVLKDMEEDGDLDWLIARAACPSCLAEKNPTDESCANCGTTLSTVIPAEYVYNGSIQQLYKGQNYGAFGGGEVFEHPSLMKLGGTSTAAAANGAAASGDPLSYEELFGEPPPDEEAVA